MFLKSFQFLLLLIIPLFAAEFTVAHRISTRETIEGETLGASIIKQKGSLLYIYSNNDRSITIYTTAGAYYGTIHPESIGRNGYLGDDFTLSKDTLYFLNSVDSRVEKFQLPSGKYLGATPFKTNIFDEEHPVLILPTRIAMFQNSLYIGNREKFLPLNGTGEAIPSRSHTHSKRSIHTNTMQYRITRDSLIGEVVR